MSRSLRGTRLAGGLLVFLFTVACGGSEEGSVKQIEPGAAASPRIVTFQASPGEVESGGPVTLSWVTEGALSLGLTDEAGRAIALDGVDVARGSVTVQPALTTTYTLTAFGDAGSRGPVYRTVRVDVAPPTADAPVIESFAASASKVKIGDEVTLSWRTTHAALLTLKDDAGVPVDLTGLSLENGSVTVRPTRALTSYSLVATGSGGRTTATVEIEVVGLTRVTRFFVDPVQPVSPGAPATLVWETARAERVVIKDDADATLIDTTDELSGSRELRLDRTTGFTITASGLGGVATAQAVVQIGATIERFAASERVVRANDPVTFSWTTSGADAAILDGPGGFHLAVADDQIDEGEAVVNVPSSGDFVLTARRGSVMRTWSTFVEVTEAPRVRSLVASQTVVTAAADHPATISLSFVQDGADSCTLYRNDEVVHAGFACARADTLDVQLFGPATFRLVAVNHAGNHQATVEVAAVSPARIAAFTKTPARRLTPGANVELGWTVTDAVAVRMEKDGVPFAIPGGAFTGTVSDVVLFDTVYTLIAENSLGTPTALDLAVTAGAPAIETFAATPAIAALGDTVTFSWTCDGGENLVLTDAGGVELLASADTAVIDEGSATVVAPTTPGTYAYTLKVTNGANQEDVATFELIVTDGPMIRSLVASKSQISLGETVDLTWAVSNDASNVVPALTLVDDHGNTYDVTGEDPNADTVTIEPPEEGRHLFTLTATTDGTRPSTATVVVEVTVAPHIVAFTADPTEISTQGGTVSPPVTIAWQTENGVDLSIWEADAQGNAIPPALHRVRLSDGDPQADLDAGSIVFHPTATTHYLLRLKNRIGSTIEETVTVLVDPPSITSFEANPADLIVGESSTLTWTTVNATHVFVQPPEADVTALPSGSFVDISGNTTAQPLNLSSNDSYQVVEFPPGFAFPFDGELRTKVRVVSNGYLSFDLASTGASTSNATFPTTSATYEYVHIAPFWDSLSAYSTGTAYWDFDPVARTVTVMWKNWSYRSTSATFDMSFEVVLHENGDFEYRYGTMFGGVSSSGTDYQKNADGDFATIGFQDTTRSWGQTLSHNNPYPGGLSNRGFKFTLATPVDGSKVVTPAVNRTYRLTARNADAAVSRTTDVRVWTVPAINVVAVTPSGPQATVPFKVSWKTTSSTRVRILDEQGSPLCTETDPGLVASGSCELTVAAAGNYTYTVEAINGIERNAVTRNFTFGVFPLLSLDSFTASKTFAVSGDQVTVSWSGRGGFEAELFACVPKTNRGQCTPIDISAQDPNGGSYTTTLTESKEFYFRLMDQMYRSAEGIANVWVDAPTVDGFSASSTQVAAGGNVTLNWSTSGAAVSSISGLPPVTAVEITGVASFIDVSTTGTELVRTNGDGDDGGYVLNFPAGFSFPFGGKATTALRASTDGWLGFDPSYTTERYINASMPTSSDANLPVSIAPFWDDLKAGSGKMYWELRTGSDGIRFLVVQWKNWEIYSSTYNPSNLNFEVVLYETGNFEYRYGNMQSKDTYPGYGNGQSATIGFQYPDRSVAHTLSHSTTITPGLSNRAWRYDLFTPADGSLTLSPSESTTYRICVTNRSLYDACEEIRVVVVKPGDLLVSELMVAPSTADSEWFEIRNLGLDPIDLAGFTVTSGATETFTVPAAPAVVVQPGGFALLARSADPAVNGGITPALAYGGAIGLDDTTDDVALLFGGVLIDRVTWAAGWPIQAGQSIELEPSVFARDPAANDASSSWCTAGGSPGALGSGCFVTGGFQYYIVDPVAGAPFIDISSTGVDVASYMGTSPYDTPMIPLGFSFPYFGDVATEVAINTKYGYLHFVPHTTYDSSNETLPAANDPDGMVAPFWDTLYERTGLSKVLYEIRSVNGRTVMIVQWHDVSAGSSSSYGNLRFQAQLWDNGDIVFAYDDVWVNPSYDYQYMYGSSATLGIENLAGDVGITLSHGTSSTGPTPVYIGRSYRFIRR